MPTISFFVKNGFFHVKISEASCRVRSKSVPPEFSPEPFQTIAPELTTPQDHDEPCQAIDNTKPAQLVKMTPLPVDARQLQKHQAWADMSTDDEAEDTDVELLRTRSDVTKYSSSDMDDSSICGEAPSVASTCASPIRKPKTPLSSKSVAFQPLSPSMPKDDATAVTTLKKAAPWRMVPRRV